MIKPSLVLKFFRVLNMLWNCMNINPHLLLSPARESLVNRDLVAPLVSVDPLDPWDPQD